MKLESQTLHSRRPADSILTARANRAQLAWISYCVAGWVIALTLSSIIALIVSSYLAEYRSGTPKVVADVLIALAVVLESAVIGYFQWRVLRRLFPTMTRGTWVGSSIIAGASGYCLSWLPTSFALTLALASRIGDTTPGPFTVATFCVVTGALVGIVWGMLQFLVLRLHAYRPGSWILASMLAWTIGFVWMYLAAFVPDRTTSPVIYVALAAVSGLGLGATVGVIEGRVLVKLRSRLLIPVDLQHNAQTTPTL